MSSIWSVDPVPDFFRDLIEVLRQEEGCYRDLTKLAGEQKTILISGKLEGLQENVRQQEKIMFSLGPMSEVRRRSLEGIGKVLGLKNPTMQDIAGRLAEDQAVTLRDTASGLMNTVRDLDAVYKTNGKLLENAQAYSKFTLEAIQGTATIRPGHPIQVKVERAGGIGLFNQKV